MRVRVAAISAALTMTRSACGGSPTGAGPGATGAGTATTAGAGTGAPSAPAAPSSGTGAAVPEILRFTAATVDGTTFDAATLAGKPAVLWFWAAWCPRCRAAAGEVAAVSADYAGRAQVVGVAGLGSGREPMKKFVTDTNIGGFPHLADDKGAVWQRFGVTAQEYFVIIDSSGRVAHKGALTGAELRGKVDGLVG